MSILDKDEFNNDVKNIGTFSNTHWHDNLVASVAIMDKELEEMCHCSLNNNCSCCEARIKVWGSE